MRIKTANQVLAGNPQAITAIKSDFVQELEGRLSRWLFNRLELDRPKHVQVRDNQIVGAIVGPLSLARLEPANMLCRIADFSLRNRLSLSRANVWIKSQRTLSMPTGKIPLGVTPSSSRMLETYRDLSPPYGRTGNSLVLYKAMCRRSSEVAIETLLNESQPTSLALGTPSCLRSPVLGYSL